MAGPSLMNILGMLPQILFTMQIVMYLVLSWVFGSIAMQGMKKRIPFGIKILVTFAVGFLCVMMGAGLRGYMFFFEGTIFQTLQIDMTIGGVIGAAVLAVALYMITRKEGGEEGEGKGNKKLQERISLLEGLLLKHKVPTMKEEDARRTAESLVSGFRAKEASLKKTDWEILLEKDGKQAIVILGAYTGEVKKIERLGESNLLSDPVRIIGIAIVIALVAFSLLNFRGLPSMTEGIASLLGMSPDDFNLLIGGSENLPPGCVSAIKILMSQGISVFGGESSYVNEAVREMIESRTGRQVALMYKVDFEGNEYVLSITLPGEMDFEDLSNEEIIKHAEICSSTEDTFCECIKIPESGGGFPTGLIIAA